MPDRIRRCAVGYPIRYEIIVRPSHASPASSPSTPTVSSPNPIHGEPYPMACDLDVTVNVLEDYMRILEQEGRGVRMDDEGEYS